MNANELANWIKDTEFYDNPNPELNDKMDEVEAMLRQQQTDITALKCLSDLDMKTKIKQQAQIEALQAELNIANLKWKSAKNSFIDVLVKMANNTHPAKTLTINDFKGKDGFIVHSDGNIFIRNIQDLNELLRKASE